MSRLNSQSEHSSLSTKHELTDTKFASVVLEMFTKLTKLHSQYLYAETADLLMAARFEEDLRSLSPKDYDNLLDLFYDPRFIIVLALLQARINDPSNLTNVVNSIFSGYKITSVEEVVLFQTLMLAHGQVWGSLVGLEGQCALDLLIKIEKERKSTRLKALESVKLSASKETGAHFLEELKSARKKPSEDTVRADIVLAEKIILTFLVSQTQDIDLKVTQICFSMVENYDDYFKEKGPKLNHHSFVYDFLFENSPTRGFLRSILPTNTLQAKGWLTQFFQNFLSTLITLTSNSDQLMNTLDGSFHEDEDKFQEAINATTKKLGILSSVRNALIEIVISSGYQHAWKNNKLCAQALATIFLEYFNTLRLQPTRNTSDLIETVLRGKFLSSISGEDEEFSTLAIKDSASAVVFSQMIDSRGVRSEPSSPEKSAASPKTKSSPTIDSAPKAKAVQPTSKWESFCLLFPCYRDQKERQEKQKRDQTVRKEKIPAFTLPPPPTHFSNK